MTKKVKETYSSSSIKELEDYQAVRKRFGMYIGSNGREGVIRLFFEALGNAIDEFNAGRCSNIFVKVDDKKHEIQVSDDGIGLFQDKIEVVCTKLHSGGKFENEYSKYSIGQNGVGLTVINALSENLTVLVKRDGYSWKQTFSKGLPTSKLQKLNKLTKTDGTGTTISFIPDIEVMEDIGMDVQEYLNLVILSSYMNKGLHFDFLGIDEKGKKIERKIYSKNGMSDYINTLDKSFLLSKPIIFENKTKYVKKVKVKGKDKEIGELSMEVELTIQFSKNDTNTIKSYCNGLETVEGGSHDTGFKMGLTEVFTKAVKESNVLTKKDGNIEILPEDIQEGIVALINTKHEDAVYSGQTKDKLKVEEMKWFVKKVTIDGFTEWIKKNPSQAKIVFQRIVAAAKGRLAANRAKNAKKKQEAGIINGLSSLSKITLATSSDPSRKRMFIVEGDSAGGGAVDCRCTETDSIARLRGKPLNTHELNESKIDKNKEFSDISISLECGMDGHFDITKLSHDQIIIMTDADVDGAHIASLLITFFFGHMRKLVEEGHLYIASAPLYKVVENGVVKFFLNTFEYNSYIADKIVTKYSIGKVVKKDGKSVLKKFTKKQIVDLLDNADKYKKILLNNYTDDNNYIDSDIIEFIVNNMGSKDKLADKISKRFNEIECTVSKKGIVHFEGMYNNAYQFGTLDKKFFSNIQRIYDFIHNKGYINLYYKKENEKANKVYLGELLNEVLKYATPKHRQRFKGLGEMDYDELWVTTMSPESGAITQLKASSLEELAKILDVHFKKDPTMRKIFLNNFEISPDDIDN